MGLNTAVIIRNDFLYAIKDDPAFGDKVYSAIIAHGRGPYHGQSFDVLPSAHADYMQIVAVGGNSIRRLGPGNAMDEANAHLIAAAPDMLATLRDIAAAIHPNMGGTQGAIRQVAVAAIAKAEGRGRGEPDA